MQSLANEAAAEVAREFHPLRAQRWAISDLNPWLAWLPAAADAVKAQRKPMAPDNPARKVERYTSEAISASLDYYREIRDAISEAAFFQTYGNVFSLYLADERDSRREAAEAAVDARELPVVKDALDAIAEGGFPEALTRTASLLAREGAPFPLERVALKRELVDEYRDLLPDLAPDQWRHIRGEQDIIVRYAPEQALATLPRLLADPADRERLLTVVERLLTDPRLSSVQPSAEQRAMLARLADVLEVSPARRRRIARTRKAGGKRRAAAPRAPATTGEDAMNADDMPEGATRNTSGCSTSASAAADADGRRASLRRELAARRRRRGAARPDRADPGRPARADRGGGDAARHRHRGTADRRRARTATTRPRRRSPSCARARPRR